MTRTLKERILVISPTVPRTDTNSAELRLYSVLEILATEYDITFVVTSSKPGDDASVPLLERHGIMVHAVTENFSLRRLLKTEKFRVAVIEYYFTA